MKTMRLSLRKKSEPKMTDIEVYFNGLTTEVALFNMNHKYASMLLADAPTWLRNVVQINQHNLKDVNSL